MRTRFHAIDFFDNPTDSFFHLLPPPPPTSPPNLAFSLTEALLHSLHGDILLTDLAIPTMPIHTALSRFYSDVLPQLVDLPQTSLQFTDQTYMVDEKRGLNIHQTFRNEVIESSVEQKTVLNFDCDYNEPKLDILQFEVPQPDTIMVNANIFREMMHVLPEVSEMDVKLDETKCDIQRPYHSQKSVYSINKIQSDYNHHEETCASEHDGYLQNHLQQCAFPHFEVDDTILENSYRPVIGNELVSLFCCMELEYQNQGGHIASGIKELFPSAGMSLGDTVECLEHENIEMDRTDLVLEKDFICLKENQSSQEQSACSVEKLDGYNYISFEPVFFQEIQFLDIGTSSNTDIFLDYTKADKPLNLCSLVKENMRFLTFDGLIVSYELVLADDVFRSLPVPIISEREGTILMQDIIWKILAESKPQPLSVSNDIYLDWHLLEDHKLNNVTSGVSEKLLKDLNHHHTELELIPYYKDMPIINMVSEDTATDSVNEECKVSLKIVSGACCTSLGNIPEVDVDKGLPRVPISDNGGLLQSKCAEMEALLTKSVPQFNDLEFFLNPQEATFGTKRVSRVEQLQSSVSGYTDNSNDCILIDTVPVKRFHSRDVRIHPVLLSDNIITLISYFQKCYLAILESVTLVHTTHTSLSLGDKSKLLRLSKQELVNEIGALIAQSTSSKDENILALLTLCAIKQMSWYLCFYGIHATHSYVHNLCSALDFLRLRLCFLQSMISDALSQSDEDITRSHPSLAKISEILSSKPFESESKILIVVEQVLWCPLKILLTSIGLSCKEIHNHQWSSYHQDPCGTSDSSKIEIDVLLNADCIIVTQKCVSGMFPFHKFALILEYGGSHVASRIPCIPQASAGLPLNFLKMELEHCDELKVFCEKSELPFSLGAALEGHATSLLQTYGIVNLQKLEQVLNFVPDSDKSALFPSRAKIAEACTVSSSTSSEEKSPHICTIPLQSSHLLFKEIVKPNHSGLSTSPEQLIVMNTEILNKEMIVSRRSTYQRLLALEKEGVQMVERDSSLPVDIIVTASICLVWYESRNLLNKVNQTEASSCLSFCIEYIATNVLMQLSFAFTGCYLVFEGNHNFTSSITEYADGLYAAAASLGIDIQLLYSHSSESTGDIILNCIRSATRFTKNLYPTMPESETVAECFLTKFPSINPLSAHAILCSVNSLSEFFQMSLEVRLQALKKYNVPEVSISLLSVLCKFGEREDTKSGTTDCSSSVSSAPESDYLQFQCKLGLGGKKRKFSCSPPKDGILVDNSLQYEPSNTKTDASLNPPRVPAQFFPRISVDPNESTDFAKLSSCLDNRFFGSQKEGRYILGDGLRTDKFKSENMADASTGEVDFDASFYCDKNIFPFEKSRTNSPLYGKRKAPESKSPRITRKLSFDAISEPTFPVASKVNFDLCRGNNTWDYEHEGTETSSDIFDFSDLGSHETLSKVGHDDLEGGAQANAKRSHIPVFQEADISCYGTPFRNAIDSYKLQQGSPWTIEFLNRVREKSMAHQKSLSCGTYPPNFAQRGSKHHTTTKRKSPSIIDFYRYQGGSSAHKIIERKTRLQEKEPLRPTEREDTSASRTPLDKRARKALSYTMSKHGSQSKLIWRDGSI
ncbi:hypothetical protein QQ045_027039 [Rhodiola kirilowii]